MNKYYTVGDLNPLTEIDFQKIEKDIGMILPYDYKEFLSNYGFGDFNELLIIKVPDKKHFKSTFQDHLDLWELTETEKPIILNGVTTVNTIDGDIILLIRDDKLPFVMIPRHSEKPVYFSSFSKLILYYKEFYNLDDTQIYFDSYHNSEIEFFQDFVQNGTPNKPLFDQIHLQFKKEISFDKLIDNAQPTYIIQKIGGWVYFDTIYKSSIRVKYQKQYKNEANSIIEFINDKVKKR